MIDGRVRQMMVAARELNVEKLPESSRNWINEKLIYTHGYGVTMNPVNGFTAEGLPTLVLGDMPVRSTLPDVKVTRPEIYFGQLTNTDVYVKTRQKEFNYPQGESNAYTSYEGKGGIPVGSLGRRILLAASRGGGDLSKVPFSDDIRPESLLLMRRNIIERVRTLAPFLTFDPDPYIVVSDDGRLYWLIDGFTASDMYPYARHYRLGDDQVNYLRNSVKAMVDAYDGTVTFYVFDAERSDHRRLPRRCSRRCSSTARGCRRTCARTCATRSCCSRCRRRSTACTTCAIPTCSTTARTCGAWRAR